NASFESSPIPPGVGYGSVVAWDAIGGTGLNGAAGPFPDNGNIPGRAPGGFLQGVGSLSQQILGLTPGASYWLQFDYNARNCCGGAIDLHVRFDGKEISLLTGVTAVTAGDYHFQNVTFTPASDHGLLEFVTTTTGDASVLLDAVNIVQ